NGVIATETHTDANLYAGVFSTTPRVIFGGTTTQQIDNNAGALRFFRPGTVEMVISSTGNVGIGTSSPGSQLVVANGGTTSSMNAGDPQFTVASSRTFKENIAPVDACDILSKIEAIPVVTYDYKNDGPKDRMGLLAEDFHQIFGRGDDKHVNGKEVQMALWLAVQQLTAQNKELKERLSALESQLKQQ